MITENAVISDTVTINAPVALVWQILVDFERYHLWNKFCPQIINKALAIGEAVFNIGYALLSSLYTIFAYRVYIESKK